MSELDKKPFLPSKTEVKQIVGGLLVVVLHIAFHFSWLYPLSLLWLIPAGDRSPHVLARLFVFSLSIFVFNRLLKYKRRIFRRLFGGFVSDPFLDAHDPVVSEPIGMKPAMEQNWHLGFVAALMLILLSGAIDFGKPWAGPIDSWGKYRWIARILEWFRTNPNTTHSLAWLFLVGSLGLFAIRVRTGWLQQTQVSNNEKAH